MQKIEIRLITLFSEWLEKKLYFLQIISHKTIINICLLDSSKRATNQHKKQVDQKNHVKTQETMNKIGDFMTYYLIRDIIKKMICLFVKKKFLTLIIYIHNR